MEAISAGRPPDVTAHGGTTGGRVAVARPWRVALDSRVAMSALTASQLRAPLTGLREARRGMACLGPSQPPRSCGPFETLRLASTLSPEPAWLLFRVPPCAITQRGAPGRWEEGGGRPRASPRERDEQGALHVAGRDRPGTSVSLASSTLPWGRPWEAGCLQALEFKGGPGQLGGSVTMSWGFLLGRKLFWGKKRAPPTGELPPCTSGLAPFVVGWSGSVPRPDAHTF